MKISSDMEIKSALHGIQYFYEVIVPKAFYSADWNRESIENAFDWIKFCEEAYVKCTGENAARIDDELHSFSNNLKHLYKTSLCFQDLQSCNTLLTQAFFENPKVDHSLIKEVLKKDNLNANIFSENLEDVIAIDSLCYGLVESLKPVSMKNSDRSLYHEIKSELFLDYLKNTMKHFSTGDLEPQLKSAFETLCENDDSRLVFFHLLLLSSEEDNKETKEIQEFGMDWLLFKMCDSKNDQLVKFIFSKLVSNLRMLCLKYESFFGYYVERLTKCANDLKQSYDQGNIIWENRKVLPNKFMLTFDEIVDHFRSLLAIDDFVGRNTKQQILEFVNSHPDKLVWNDVSLQLSIL